MRAADEETWKLVRQHIGQSQLALLIAAGLIAMTTGTLNAESVAESFGIKERAAQIRIDNAAVKKLVND